LRRSAFASPPESTPSGASTGRHRTVSCQRTLSIEERVFDPSTSQPLLASGFRRFPQVAGFVSPAGRGYQTQPASQTHVQTARKGTAAPWEPSEPMLCGLGIETGGALAGNYPLASNPYPKAFCVSTSRTLRPKRCGSFSLPPPSSWQSNMLPNLQVKCKRNFFRSARIGPTLFYPCHPQ